MGFPAFVFSILLGAAAPAAQPASAAPAAPGAHVHSHDEDINGTFSWCVLEEPVKAGKIRYFSDLFEGDAGTYVESAYQEYVGYNYPHKDKVGDFVTTCKTLETHEKAEAALKLAMTPEANARDITTAWKTHFE